MAAAGRPRAARLGADPVRGHAPAVVAAPSGDPAARPVHAGYLRDTRIGAAVYNLGHAYPLPAAMSLVGAVGHHPLTLALGLLWLAHSGMDRLARNGLKYDLSFQHTPLGGPGPADPP